MNAQGILRAYSKRRNYQILQEALSGGGMMDPVEKNSSVISALVITGSLSLSGIC